ncbi:hypothetical protein [Actinomycetospora cinnamomea]|nr:hypothetical protein [Actinomycetospora cinnamomea]
MRRTPGRIPDSTGTPSTLEPTWDHDELATPHLPYITHPRELLTELAR